MPIKQTTKVYGIDKLMLYPITKDDSTGFAVGEGIHVPTTQISITFEGDEKELTGDEKVLDTIKKTKSLTITTELSKLSLDFLELATGGDLTVDETEARISIGSNATSVQTAYQLIAQIKTTDNEGGDLHFVAYKCKATDFPLNGTYDDYSKMSVTHKAVYTEHTFTEGNEEKLLEVIAHSVATEPTPITSGTGA